MARVSQLSLAETHKLLTVPHILDISRQQLVRRRLLLHGLQRWYESATVVRTVTSQTRGSPLRQGMRVQPSGRLPSL